MGMQLTAGQKQSYADDGLLIVRDVFAAAELERLERGAVAADLRDFLMSMGGMTTALGLLSSGHTIALRDGPLWLCSH